MGKEKLSIGEVVAWYKNTTKLSFQKFADSLTENFNKDLSRQAVNYWFHDVTEPETDFMLQIWITYQDWRQYFAWDVLNTKLPEAFNSDDTFFRKFFLLDRKNKNTMEVKDQVTQYQEWSGLTLRGFVATLTESVKMDDLSHVALQYWKDGKTVPETDFLIQCLIAYDDWRAMFAYDMLRAKLPEVFIDGNLERKRKEFGEAGYGKVVLGNVAGPDGE